MIINRAVRLSRLVNDRYRAFMNRRSHGIRGHRDRRLAVPATMGIAAGATFRRHYASSATAALPRPRASEVRRDRIANICRHGQSPEIEHKHRHSLPPAPSATGRDLTARAMAQTAISGEKTRLSSPGTEKGRGRNGLVGCRPQSAVPDFCGYPSWQLVRAFRARHLRLIVATADCYAFGNGGTNSNRCTTPRVVRASKPDSYPWRGSHEFRVAHQRRTDLTCSPHGSRAPKRYLPLRPNERPSRNFSACGFPPFSRTPTLPRHHSGHQAQPSGAVSGRTGLGRRRLNPDLSGEPRSRELAVAAVLGGLVKDSDSSQCCAIRISKRTLAAHRHSASLCFPPYVIAIGCAIHWAQLTTCCL